MITVLHDIIPTVTLYSYSTISISLQWYQSFMIILNRLGQNVDEFKMGHSFIVYELLPCLVSFVFAQS